MNAEQATTYLQALMASVTIGVIVPLLILAVMLIGIWRLVIFAQRQPDFDIAQIFRDPDTGKVTTPRFLMLMAFAFSSWYLAVKVMGSKTEAAEFYAYLGAWASSLTFLKLAEKWNGALPFAKAPEVQQ